MPKDWLRWIWGICSKRVTYIAVIRGKLHFIVYTVEKSNIGSLNTYRDFHYVTAKEDFYVTKIKGENSEVYRFIVDKKEVCNV